MIEIEKGVWIPVEMWEALQSPSSNVEENQGESLSEILGMTYQRLAESQEQLPDEFEEILNDNFWDIIEED